MTDHSESQLDHENSEPGGKQKRPLSAVRSLRSRLSTSSGRDISRIRFCHNVPTGNREPSTCYVLVRLLSAAPPLSSRSPTGVLLPHCQVCLHRVTRYQALMRFPFISHSLACRNLIELAVCLQSQPVLRVRSVIVDCHLTCPLSRVSCSTSQCREMGWMSD